MTPVAILGQEMHNARSLGMAGSNVAVAEANEYLGGNPAVLAVKKYYGFELQLVSAHLMVKNNSYSLTEYDKYFTTGDSLTSTDINNLLGKIPDKGWQGDFSTGIRGFSFYSRPFSLNFGAIGSGHLDFPKDPLTFPFYGNTVIEEFSIDGLEAEAWGAASLDFGIAFPITQWTPVEFDFVSVGLAAKYLIGIGYASLQSTTGALTTTPEYMLVDFYGESRRSEGGRGYGLDLGVLGIYQKNWTLSLHFSNLLGDIYWNKNNEFSMLRYQSDSLFQLEDISDLSQVDVDTTMATGKFRTALPKKAVVAVAYQYSPDLIFTGSYYQGLNTVYGNSLTPQLSLGTEYKPLSFFPLRAGVALGGDLGFSLGLGLGIDLKYWQLNLAYLNHNFKWFRSARSVDIALTTQFRL